jgi:hypothetical protein
LFLLDDKTKNFYSEKSLNLKAYEYQNIVMDNYGDPILDKNNNLIGYKISHNKYASVEIYYNENNLLCNKVSIRELDGNNLKSEPIDS